MARGDGFFRDSKMPTSEHERFVRQNKMIAEADQPPVARTQKGYTVSENTKSCLNCGIKRMCKRFSVKTVHGCASVGGSGNDDIFKACEKWEERKSQSDPKKVKSLMKSFAKQFRM